MNEVVEKKVKASVLMSAYNAEKTIAEAIESILEQTFGDFEFIIIDDASTDKTLEIIRKYKDSRIRLFSNLYNIGLTRSLNRGLKIAKGEYIVRMDSDDISLPTRLEKQICYMDQNRNVALSSCSNIAFGAECKKNIINYDEKTIKALLIFNSVLPHPGFIFRQTLIKEGYKYNKFFKYAQDYEFQVHVSRKYTITCLRECLVKYRTSAEQISVVKYEEQMKYANITRARQFLNYGVRLNCDEAKIMQITCQDKIYDLSIIQKIRAVMIICRLKYHVSIMKVNESKQICKVCNEYIRKIEKSFVRKGK